MLCFAMHQTLPWTGEIGRSAALFATGIAALLTAAAYGQAPGFTGTNTRVTTGPDVTVWSVGAGDSDGFGNGVLQYTEEGDVVRAYAIATDSCNVGSEPVNWCDEESCVATDPPVATTDHPVIAQNLYRLHEGRFQQIGKNWFKHGFAASNGWRTPCRGNDGSGNPVGCQDPSGDPDLLFVGCTDFYSAQLNGLQTQLGPRSQVNPTTGDFPDPDTIEGDGGEIGKRIQVAESDLVTDPNPGDELPTRYWIEGHYVAPDDALAGNGLNNASYREVVLGPAPDLELSVTGDTVREAAAIWAWQAIDPAVEIAIVDVPGSGPVERFHVARRITEQVGARGTSWHVEVVVHNLNSARAAGGLTIQSVPTATITAPGFHDVDDHSGEIWDNVNWAVTVGSPAGSVRWRTQLAHAVDPEANALRWGNAYTFWFDLDQPPETAVWTLELFTPGSPNSVIIDFEEIFSDGFETGHIGAWTPAGRRIP